jgi:excisionase family DNA binding protein
LNDELLTKAEMARYLKIAEVTLDKWRKEGLPAIKVNRKVLFDKTKVMEWLNQKSK